MAVAFSVSKPFRQRLYKNWLLMIYLIVVLFYSIWITINCDNWSKNLFGLFDLEKVGDIEEEEEGGDEGGEDTSDDTSEDASDDDGEEEEEEETASGEELIEGGDKMKYYILIIIGVNAVVNLIIEWVIMKFVRCCYEERQIRNYKKEILEEKMRLGSQDNNTTKKKEVSIYKYQRVYYYDRRKKMEKLEKEKGNTNDDLTSTRKLKVNAS